MSAFTEPLAQVREAQENLYRALQRLPGAFMYVEEEWDALDAALRAQAEAGAEWEAIAREKHGGGLASWEYERRRAAEARLAEAREALRRINALDEDDFKSAWHYQNAVRFFARAALTEDGTKPQSNVCPCGYDGNEPCNGCPDGCKRRPAGITGWDHIDAALPAREEGAA